MSSLGTDGRQALLKALNTAITSGDDLEVFVGTQLGTPIGKITPPAALPVMILRITQWAEANGDTLAQLLEGALESFGQNHEVAGTVPPLLELVRGHRRKEVNQARVQQAGTMNLEELTANLGKLVTVLQRMSPAADPRLAQQALEAGARAVGKLQDQGDEADLTTDEQTGLDTIILATARPALLIQQGGFSTPPEQWKGLAEKDELIRRAIAATGRIETPNHTHPWVGTAFLVAPHVIATASYMADPLAQRRGDKWTFNRKVGSRVNFLQEYGSKASATFDLKSVIAFDERLGMALFEISARNAAGQKLPVPIPVAGKWEPDKGRTVFLIGYAARDGRRAEQVSKGPFGDIFDVKRLCPGQVLRVDPESNRRSVIEHDCSSATGMGGAPLLDVETGAVLALHYAAKYMVAGYARRLSLLRGTRIAKDAGMVFRD